MTSASGAYLAKISFAVSMLNEGVSKKKAVAATRTSPVCRMHVFCFISCATVLRVVVCQAAFLQAEPDDFGAFLDNYPLEFYAGRTRSTALVPFAADACGHASEAML